MSDTLRVVSKKKKAPRVVEDGAWERNLKMPLLEVEELIVKSTTEDVAWSYALREFRCFSEEIQDAIWALFKKPDSSILKALHALMTKAITKKIMTSGIRVTADIDLIETEDVILLETDSVPLVGRVAVLLHEMQDKSFEEEKISVRVRGDNELVVISNSTWMTQSLVESMVLSLQHSKLLNEMGLDQAMIGNLLKSGEKLLPAVMDFFVDQVTVLFDEKLLLLPIHRGGDGTFASKLSVYAGTMEKFDSRYDVTGTYPRVINFSRFKKFLQECESVDKNFSSILFCYMYAQDARAIFDMFINHNQDDDFILYGAPSMESWVDGAVASKTVNGHDFRFTDDGSEEQESAARIEAMMAIDVHVDDLAGTNRENPESFFRSVDDRYMDGVSSMMEYTDRDAMKSIAGVRFEGLSHDALEELAVKHSRMARVAAFGEDLRVVRLGGYDGRADSETNVLADMFPDQYRVFYQDMLVDGLVLPSDENNVVVTNAAYMGDYLKTRYPKEQTEIVRKYTVADSFNAYEWNEADILMLDLNTGTYDSESRGKGRFKKTWASPLLVNQAEVRSALTQIFMYMGGDDRRNVEDSLTAWVRVPVLIDFHSFVILYKIMTSLTHRVSVMYPKGMHEPYFDIKIYPIVYKKASVSDHVATLLARVATLNLYAMRFFDHYTMHLYEGIRNRHILYEFSATGITYRWKSNRYKLLASLDFRIVIDVERVKHIRQVVTLDAGRRVKKENAKKKARALKHGVASYKKRAEQVLGKFKMGERAGGMKDIKK